MGLRFLKDGGQNQKYSISVRIVHNEQEEFLKDLEPHKNVSVSII